MSSNSFENKFINKLLHTIYIQGSLNKFSDFFCMGTFIESTHMKL